MTTQVETVAALAHNLLALGALWVLVFCCWRNYRVDRIRDHLFQLRYELFSLAERGEIPFNHPGYWMLRLQLNRLLARAHRITGIRLLLSSPQSIPDPRRHWVESLRTLAPEMRQKLQEIEARMAVAIFWQVLLGSPLSFAIAVSRILLTKTMGESSQKPSRDTFVDAVSRDAFEVPIEQQEEALLSVG
jgi:hypothetical protein